MSTPGSGGPTVVLVHGAFADAGSWSGVAARLLQAGVPVRAIVSPLRGVTADAAYVASAIKQISGPVLVVGHSYGGVVITNAVSQVTNAVGLVYVAGFLPDEGETLGDILGRSTDSLLLVSVVPSEYPTGNGTETATEFVIDPAKAHAVFAGDLTKVQADVMAYSQRPVAGAALAEKTGVPAWKNLPVWSIVATGDKAAGSDVVRSTAQRAGAAITELDGSHVIMISQPEAVTEIILAAVKAVRPSVAVAV